MAHSRTSGSSRAKHARKKTNVTMPVKRTSGMNNMVSHTKLPDIDISTGPVLASSAMRRDLRNSGRARKISALMFCPRLKR